MMEETQKIFDMGISYYPHAELLFKEGKISQNQLDICYNLINPHIIQAGMLLFPIECFKKRYPEFREITL